MGVAPGGLSAARRAEICDFYGALLGWREIEALRRADRLTIAIGGGCYVNVREIAGTVPGSGYEHFGVRVESAEELERLWAELDARGVAELTEISGAGRVRTFRFRHLLPLAVELQYFPPDLAG